MLSGVLAAYGLNEEATKIEVFGKGLINQTWKLRAVEEEFILQRINQNVFSNPFDLAHNIQLVSDHIRLFHPDNKFAAPVCSLNGRQMVCENENYFRLFPFVKNSHSIEVVTTASQAYEAAMQFGRFTRMLKNFDAGQLKITIPRFHDLSLRFHQFLSAVKNGDLERISESKELIVILQQHSDIVSEYEKIRKSPDFRQRVTHHDTKISNVLFDRNEKSICVIDLDTVMSGYFFSDLGDMMRTYLSPANEEEKNLDAIEVRDDFYKAVAQGYADEMKDELTSLEKEYFFYAGKFMIYMQALRFLTDHLNLDVYYGAQYPGHNFNRAKNQVVLLKRFLEKERSLRFEVGPKF